MATSSSKLIVGLMSGTSLDGIDAVLLRVRGSGRSTKFKQMASVHKAYPADLKRMILRSSRPDTSRVDEIARLNFLLAYLYADAVYAVARRGNVRLSQITLVGSHGQTIQHLPGRIRIFGKSVGATLQIGDPSVLATLTGIPTVGGFRVADMAVGGQGAPLVPYFDWLAFRSQTRNRLLLNIGGIANITVLPKNCRVDQVRAFDTGPGNMVVDALMRELYGKPFDKDGICARAGMIILDLFCWLQNNPYLKKAPPKSTGREMFGELFVKEILRRAKRYDKRDIVATVSAFTPFTVFDGYKRFVEKNVRIDEVIVSGGGARNKFFLDELRRYFGRATVMLSDELGVPVSTKEAICFAILANETLAGHPTNIPQVTGARRSVVLGKISKP